MKPWWWLTRLIIYMKLCILTSFLIFIHVCIDKELHSSYIASALYFGWYTCSLFLQVQYILSQPSSVFTFIPGCWPRNTVKLSSSPETADSILRTAWPLSQHSGRSLTLPHTVLGSTLGSSQTSWQRIPPSVFEVEVASWLKGVGSTRNDRGINGCLYSPETLLKMALNLTKADKIVTVLTPCMTTLSLTMD